MQSVTGRRTVSASEHLFNVAVHQGLCYMLYDMMLYVISALH